MGHAHPSDLGGQGLRPGGDYNVYRNNEIYEYNNTGTDTKYITSTASNNPKSQSTLTGSCTATWQGDTETFGRWEWGTAGNWDIDIVPTSV